MPNTNPPHFPMLRTMNCGHGMRRLSFEASNSTYLEATRADRTICYVHNEILKIIASVASGFITFAADSYGQATRTT